MKRIHIRNYPFRLRLHLLPILVWLGALACVIGLFSRRSQRFEVLGMAQGQRHQVASATVGRITSVSVRLFEKVEKGQPLAVLNTVLEDEQPRSQLQAQLDTVLSEIEHLTAQLVPTQDSLSAEKSDRQTTRISDARRFSVDVENARLEILRLQAVIETDRITLDDLALDVRVAEKLVAEQALAPFELQKAEAQYNALAKKIEENQNLLTQANTALEQSLKRRDEYVQHQPYHRSVDSALEVIRKAITVQEKRVDELVTQLEHMDRRKALELKAPIDGVISEILHRQTEVVLAGEPILTIADGEITDVIAYAGSGLMDKVQEGMAVELIKTSEPAKVEIESSEVTYVGPVVEQMPPQLWLNPNVPQWGRPFLIKAPAVMKLTAGETVGVRTQQRSDR
ncbi:MAG: HlyD family secretion protein [Planctomycetota bacterium]|jgi:multidrug resistance efflux pump